MIDICMCKGEGCPMKEKCLRFTAAPDENWQSYFVESPVKGKKDKTDCEFFMPRPK